MVFTRKGLISKAYLGLENGPHWALFEHNTQKHIKTYNSFGECINNVYPETIEGHRPPTRAEIRFGEGATHYKIFSTLDCVKPCGTLKKWIKCPYDGLRYNLG